MCELVPCVCDARLVRFELPCVLSNSQSLPKHRSRADSSTLHERVTALASSLEKLKKLGTLTVTVFNPFFEALPPILVSSQQVFGEAPLNSKL